MNKPIEHDTTTILHNLELPINQAEEDCESNCELPDELARLLEQESKEIQPSQEHVEVICNAPVSILLFLVDFNMFGVFL